MKRNHITYVALGAVTLAVLGGGLYANTASAQFDANRHTAFIERIATRFGLDQNEVQEFLSEIREEFREERAERFGARLDQAIQNGDITEAQKALILEKREELHDQFEEQRETFRDLSIQERREVKEARKADIQAWAEANGIDAKYLHPHRGHKRGHVKHRDVRGGDRPLHNAPQLQQEV